MSLLVLALSTAASSQVWMGLSGATTLLMDTQGNSTGAALSFNPNKNLYINNTGSSDIQVRYNLSTSSSEGPKHSVSLAGASSTSFAVGGTTAMPAGATYQVWIKRGIKPWVHCGSVLIQG